MWQLISKAINALILAFRSATPAPVAPLPNFPPPKPGPLPPPPVVPAPPTPAPAPAPVGTPADAFDAFFAKYNGKLVNVDRNPFGAQCVELANAWCYFLGIERFPGNAMDFQFDRHPDCDWIANMPTNKPQKGDIVVWGKINWLPYGHVGICKSATVMTFASFDQNWPLNSAAHLQSHNYSDVHGWLRPLSAAERLKRRRLGQ